MTNLIKLEPRWQRPQFGEQTPDLDIERETVAGKEKKKKLFDN